MKYWLDTEFIEDGKTIDLISIGFVAEDGREFYAVNIDCDHTKASDWVKQNVIVHLPQKSFSPQDSPRIQQESLAWMTRPAIKAEVALFLGCERLNPFSLDFFFPENRSKPEIWGYYADYDWVAFCQLFGTMMDLPKGLPMYCRDIKQWADMLGNPKLPEQGEGEHHALADARWNKSAWDFLNSYKGEPK